MTVSTLKTTDVRSRIEPELKDRAAEVLEACGLNLSDAIRLFLRQVVTQQGLPFEVKTPNATTLAAMREARSISRARFGSAQEEGRPGIVRNPQKKRLADCSKTKSHLADAKAGFHRPVLFN